MHVAVGVSEVHQVWFRETDGSVQVYALLYLVSLFTVVLERRGFCKLPVSAPAWGVRGLSLGWHGAIGPGVGGMRWGEGGAVTVWKSPTLSCSVLPSHVAPEPLWSIPAFWLFLLFFDHFLSFCFMQVPEFRKQLKPFWTVKKIKLGMHFFPL